MTDSSWVRTRLGDFVTLQRGHDLPDAVRRPGHTPVVGSFGVTGWHDEARAAGPGVTVGRSGASFGVVTYSPVDYWPLNTALYVTKFHGNDERFAYYFLKQFDFRTYNSGSAQPSLNRNFIHPIPVDVPPLFEQHAIAHILGTLDDKIELNRRMNETLETMARALFKDWFVDFGPVRAKAEGRDPGLPQSLADLFPARLVDSNLGAIPEGWPVETLANHCEAVKGVSYKGSGLGDGGVPLHNLNSIHEGGGYKYEGIKYYSGEHAERHVVLPGEVIVANTEQGHERLLIGYAAVVPSFYGNYCIASHHIYRVRPKPGSQLKASYICSLLNSPQMHDVVSGFANGTTVNMLPLDALQKPLIVCPPGALVEAYDAVAVNAGRRCEEMLSESDTLATLRDRLLPKLISGELPVEDGERLIEEAV